MDDNPKARGWKHRTNKKKYNKNKPGAHISPSKPKNVTLDSNWDRYEQETIERKVSSSTDFSILASAPISQGSHFQFKSDKDIALDLTEPVKTSDLFSLDLVLLDKSLATLPFSVRSGISEIYFTENQQRVMTELSHNMSDYLEYVKGYQRQITPVFGSDNETSEEEQNTPKQDLATCLSTPEPPPKPPNTGEGDLEEWLDDILDD